MSSIMRAVCAAGERIAEPELGDQLILSGVFDLDAYDEFMEIALIVALLTRARN